jgi:hypothetical protein
VSAGASAVLQLAWLKVVDTHIVAAGLAPCLQPVALSVKPLYQFNSLGCMLVAARVRVQLQALDSGTPGHEGCRCRQSLPKLIPEPTHSATTSQMVSRFNMGCVFS